MPGYSTIMNTRYTRDNGSDTKKLFRQITKKKKKKKKPKKKKGKQEERKKKRSVTYKIKEVMVPIDQSQNFESLNDRRECP